MAPPPAPEAKSKRPENSAFKQQTLKAWRPILTPRLVVMLFSGVGIIFLPIGIAIIVASNQIATVETADYGANTAAPTWPDGGGCCIDKCDGNPWERVDANPCSITLNIGSTMKPPVYMYYKLTNYYQNHRRYVRSRSDEQLVGDETFEAEDLESTCSYHFEAPWDGNAVINPCGLISWSWFNDTYKIYKPDGTSITLDQTSIAWESDLNTKFSNNAQGQTGQNFPPFAFWRNITCSDDPTPGTGLATRTADQIQACTDANAATPGVGWCFPGSGFCTEDQHFVVWMRSAGLPNFRKLYAKIDEELAPGTYTVEVSSGAPQTNATGATNYYNFGYPLGNAVPTQQTFLYPVGSFSGTKSVVLSTVTWIGGKNYFLGYAYLVVGIVCIVLAICFFVKSRSGPRDLGNAPYVSWNKEATPK